MREIAKATPRLVALSLGAEDFALSVGMEPIGETLETPKQTMIIAARAAGILPLGFMGTVADFEDLDAVSPGRAPLAQVRLRRGTCIHPSVGPRCSTRSTASPTPRPSTALSA